MKNMRLNADQILDLNKILRIMIPPDKQKNLPGADEIDLLDFIIQYYPDFIEKISYELEKLNHFTKERHDSSLRDLSDSTILSLCEELKRQKENFLNELTLITFECYYQSVRVLDNIGITRKPPFPEGNKVLSGNLELLKPVRKMGTKYIEV